MKLRKMLLGAKISEFYIFSVMQSNLYNISWNQTNNQTFLFDTVLQYMYVNAIQYDRFRIVVLTFLYEYLRKLSLQHFKHLFSCHTIKSKCDDKNVLQNTF